MFGMSPRPPVLKIPCTFSGEFGCLEWSHSETHLLYVAEQKRPTAKSFFDTSVKSSDQDKKDAVKVSFIIFFFTKEIVIFFTYVSDFLKPKYCVRGGYI